MNPFLFLIKILEIFVEVRVASSNPPGIIPIFLPFFIKLTKLYLFTPLTSHQVKNIPIIGNTSKALDANPLHLKNTILLNVKPKLKIPCGCIAIRLLLLSIYYLVINSHLSKYW